MVALYLHLNSALTHLQPLCALRLITFSLVFLQSKTQEATAEYATPPAVLTNMAEQEYHREKLQRLEANDKLTVQDQEAAVLTSHLEAAKDKAALLKKQQDENAARKKVC